MESNRDWRRKWIKESDTTHFQTGRVHVRWKWRHERIKLPERITRRVLYVFRFEGIAYSHRVIFHNRFQLEATIVDNVFISLRMKWRTVYLLRDVSGIFEIYILYEERNDKIIFSFLPLFFVVTFCWYLNQYIYYFLSFIKL